MAILRGGTRIFGQDIRIGIPRDKSLVIVAGDKRLQRRPGNLGSTIGQLKTVYQRGLGAYYSQGSRPGVSAHQWAAGRVRSYATGKGGARKADADLRRGGKKKTK